jgi:hypothetical protein
MKKKTNQQLLKALVEELKNDFLASAILREKILNVMQETAELAEADEKENKRNAIIAPRVFIELNKLVIEKIGYENN